MHDFVHLHNHSDFTFIRGMSHITGIVARAKELEMKAIALTDDGNLFGVQPFFETCNKEGIKPVIGCDFYVAKDTHHPMSQSESYSDPSRVVLLAKNRDGYKNLLKLSSYAHSEGFNHFPFIDSKSMQRYYNGLILLTGSPAGEPPPTCQHR